MLELAFVILHYKTFKTTIDCVNSILNNVPEAPIVIVDNGSCNGTGKKLSEFYRNNTIVSVLCLENNLGFANGNNEGIYYIKKHYSTRFIAVMNNDTLIIQKNFLEIVVNEYEKSGFSVLGPQICTKDGIITSSPVEYIVDTKKKALVLLLKRRIKLLLNKLYLNRLIHDVGMVTKHSGKYNNLQRYENVKLHGACWIFSENFFKKFNGINSTTFLYFEEDILYLEIKKKGLLTVYNPELKIIHLEDVSTNSITKSNREKNIFVLENEIQSLRTLIKILN